MHPLKAEKRIVHSYYHSIFDEHQSDIKIRHLALCLDRVLALQGCLDLAPPDALLREFGRIQAEVERI